jgi:hypothetical protein
MRDFLCHFCLELVNLLKTGSWFRSSDEDKFFVLKEIFEGELE